LGVVSSATALTTWAAEAYQADGVFVEFVAGNQATLLADLTAGQLNGLLLHQIPAGNENWFNPVAVDGLVIIVHPENPVSSLTLAEVQAVFNGRITNWASLGGPDQPIVLLSREPGAGTRSLLNQRVLAEQRLDINAELVSSNEGLLTAVATTPHAIGYSMMGNSSLADVKLLAIDDILPTRNEVGSQRYPLTVPLYFLHHSPDEPEDELRHFLAWLQSPDGQQRIGTIYGRVR
jgi:phosphate transport system substrate-binding protein